MRLLLVSASLALTLLFAAPAGAFPVATDETSYTFLGRVFPDPLAGCQGGGEKSGCSPHAQGNFPAVQFVQVDEFVDAIQYMNTSETHPDWRRYMEVLPLDGKKGDGAGTGLGDDAFPGNNLPSLEFTPDPKFQSAGLATTGGGKKKSDIYVVRVTDETVPDKDKKRYALSLSIHGIERAGIEGGTRAIEDLVTAATTPSASGEEGKTRLDDRILPGAFSEQGPTFRDVLKKTIIYFSFPNPDGWRRGSPTAIPNGGSVFFQRYNGNGVDVNRDWPGVGYTFRPYSSLSEPESRALSSFFMDVKGTTNSEFAAGDDLHGQPFADALSYTLIPNASKSFDKNLRIRETSKLINQTAFEALKWSPLIQPNDQPVGGPFPCGPDVLGPVCGQIYAQTWGTVYDTINYTTTGALGDWFDSQIGLDSDGIDNEMSFSHLDRDIRFEPQTEQLHVDGNKFLIFAHLASIIDPALGKFVAEGRKGYVPNVRQTREERDFNLIAPPNTKPQDNETGSGVSTIQGETLIPFEVKRTDPTATEPGIFNGGLRADVRTNNVGGIGTGMATLEVQCRFCDDHPGVEPDGEGWITVQEDFNQSFVYAQAGVTAAVNRPQAFNGEGKQVEWRARISGVVFPGPVNLDVDFTSGPATTDGDTGGGAPSKLLAYDVANTDVFDALNSAVPEGGDRFETVDPRKVIEGTQSLTGLRSLVLADNALPGYLGPYTGDVPVPTGPPTPDFEYEGQGDTVPGGGTGAPGTFEDREFTIDKNAANKSVTVRVTVEEATNDLDLTLLRIDEEGEEQEVDSSGNGPPETVEEVLVERPPPGKYIIRVDNYAAADPSFKGTVTFTKLEGSGQTATGAFTAQERDTWFAKLREYVEGGGNLVLTDGALRALPSLSDLAPETVNRQPVYAGQMTFAKSSADDDTTLEDPLAKDVAQPGARFNSGMRRQTYEPVPVGYAIQNSAGADSSQARQYDIDRAAFEKAGGRVAATSANSAPRTTAPVYDRVTLGEIKRGSGTIRVAGALLPQPTTEFDHPFGLSPHGLTYTGYIIVCNLLGADCSVRSGTSVDRPPPVKPDPRPTPTPTPGGNTQTGGNPPGGTTKPGDGCIPSGGIRTVDVRGRGRGLRLGFTRRTNAPVTVDVFRVSRGSRVIKERLVARFRNRDASFSWNGRTNRSGSRKRVGDGYYFVRYAMEQGGRNIDVRREVLRRQGGKWSRRPEFFRRERCDLVRRFKLERPVFGGPRRVNLKGAYRLSAPARVTVTITKGSKVVRRYSEASRAAGRTYRFALPASNRARGDYRVKIRAVSANDQVETTLTSRRL